VEVADTLVAAGMVGRTVAAVDNTVAAVVEVCLRWVVDHTVEMDNTVVAVVQVCLRWVVA